jgi:hypothetical protein
MADVPSQSHSSTSVNSAKSVNERRARAQERWIYESLRRSSKADWELWNEVEENDLEFFSRNKHTSGCRARIGLRWVNRVTGETPWHPVEDSGRKIVNPETGEKCQVWQIKEKYRDMPYDKWSKEFRQLARGKIEDLQLPLFLDIP